MNTVISLDEHRPSPPLMRAETILELPVRRVCRTLADLVAYLDDVGLRSDLVADGHSATAKTAALLYVHARHNGCLIEPSAMPRVTHLHTLDRWREWFGPEFPLTAFLPFVVKGRG